MRLIDADALLEKENIKEVTVGARHSGKTVFGACKTYLHFAIEAAPTIDAVPVTRCKDCKHFVQGAPYDPCECMKWTTRWGIAYTETDGFCHKGERRSDA